MPRAPRLHPLVSTVWKINAALAAAFMAVLAGQGGVSSVLDYKDVQSEPFDGMEYPVRYVPNWTKAGVWTTSTKYADIDPKDFVEIPRYDAKLLAVTDPDDEKALMARYTYITAYMGAYMDDARKEYAGSHLAVDVRAALGTPVRAVANGVVTRVKTDPGGDGEYVVVRHAGVPYDGRTVEMYSSYLHVDAISVQPGQKVRRGDTLAKVGMTGITTTPHLHFQIDRANAPFFPYWPFTFAEAKKAGYDFFSAINAGLGAQGALAYTYPPFAVINQNLGYSAPSVVTAAPKPAAVAISTPAPKPEPAQAKNPEPAPAPEPSVDQTKILAAASSLFSSAPAAKPAPASAPAVVSVPAPTPEPQTAAPAPADESAPSALSAVTEPLAVPDVRDVLVQTAPANATPGASVAQMASIVFASAPPEPAAAPEIKPVPAPAPATKPAVAAVPVSAPAKPAVSKPRFSDVPASSVYFPAVEALVAKGAVKGVSKTRFAPANAVTRAEALAIVMRALDIPVDPKARVALKDVPASHWVQPFLAKAVELGAIAPGRTSFGPNKPVTRAEVAALLFALGGTPTGGLELSRPADVSAKAWYAPYARAAVTYGVMKAFNGSFRPDASMRRGDMTVAVWNFLRKFQPQALS